MEINVAKARKELARTLKFNMRYLLNQGMTPEVNDFIIWDCYHSMSSTVLFSKRIGIISYKEFELINNYITNLKNKALNL